MVDEKHKTIRCNDEIDVDDRSSGALAPLFLWCGPDRGAVTAFNGWEGNTNNDAIQPVGIWPNGVSWTKLVTLPNGSKRCRADMRCPGCELFDVFSLMFLHLDLIGH